MKPKPSSPLLSYQQSSHCLTERAVISHLHGQCKLLSFYLGHLFSHLSQRGQRYGGQAIHVDHQLSARHAGHSTLTQAQSMQYNIHCTLWPMHEVSQRKMYKSASCVCSCQCLSESSEARGRRPAAGGLCVNLISRRHTRHHTYTTTHTLSIYMRGSDLSFFDALKLFLQRFLPATPVL